MAGSLDRALSPGSRKELHEDVAGKWQGRKLGRRVVTWSLPSQCVAGKPTLIVPRSIYIEAEGNLSQMASEKFLLQSLCRKGMWLEMRAFCLSATQTLAGMHTYQLSPEMTTELTVQSSARSPS